MTKKYSRDGVIAHKYIEMMRLLNIYLNHFPKHERHALCATIRSTSYELWNLMAEVHKRHYKKTTLTSLDIKHEQLRMLIYLAYEMGYFRFHIGSKIENEAENVESHRFLTISKCINELGKLIGAWISNCKEKGEW